MTAHFNPGAHGIDAERLKRDYAFGHAGEFNIEVVDGKIVLVPVRAGEHPNIPTDLTPEQAAEDYPLLPPER